MEINFRIPEYIKRVFDKYKYPFVIFAVGMLMVIMSSKTNDEQTLPVQMEEKNLFVMETQIERALEKIDGVGRVEVILSLKSSEQNIYVKENGEKTSEIVIVNENGNRKPLVEYRQSPVYKGALIVCDGGEDGKVKLEITDAVKALTGISSQNIIISKMKK